MRIEPDDELDTKEYGEDFIERCGDLPTHLRKHFLLTFEQAVRAEERKRIAEWARGKIDKLLAEADGLMDDETRAMKLAAIVRNGFIADFLTFLTPSKEGK